MTASGKVGVEGLAFFGGQPAFLTPISTSNLVRPDIEQFLAYSRQFYAAGQYTNGGPLVGLLERRLAEFHHTRYCVSFCSGFWALVLAIRCLAIPGRREVVMPSLTYRRLADVVSWAGLVPRFCEVDATTLAASPQTMASQLSDDTALILAVHPIVNCCDAAGLEQFAADAGLPLLFDAVESVYETVGGRKVGSFGRAECFSLHASKLLNGFEGGYITTNDADLDRRLRRMRSFGFEGQDRVADFGTNAKLNEAHAAMALACLDDLEDQVERNRQRYRTYQQALQPLPGVELLPFDETEKCAFKNIVVRLNADWPLSRDMTVALLNAEHILARAYYAPLHARSYGYEVAVKTDLSQSERLSGQYINMPCGHLVTGDDIRRVIALLTFIKDQATQIVARAK